MIEMLQCAVRQYPFGISDGIDFSAMPIAEQAEIEQLAGCREILTLEDVGHCSGFRKNSG